MKGKADTAPGGAAPYTDDAGSLAESTSPAPALWSRDAAAMLNDARGFRQAAAWVTARLLRRHGGYALAAVEDAVQEAFVAAARAWPVSGYPEQPLAWLHRVAARRYLDQARAGRRLEWQADAGVAVAAAAPPLDEEGLPGADDQLGLLFLCCHPALSPESRLALTLKCAVQLSVPEIARLLRVDTAALAQRLVRAKRTLREVRASFVVPPPGERPQRLHDVLGVCYALFAEGHLPTSGEATVRPELCHEALRLVLLLAQWPPTARAETHALLALLCLTAARLPARDAHAVTSAPLEWIAIPLREQDRSQWDRRLIARGTRALAAAAHGEVRTRFHLEAEIAWHHSTAPSWEATPWPRIVQAYEELLAVAPSPLVRLARWVAMAEAGDAAKALAEVEAAREALDAAHAGWPEWPATLGLLYGRTGQATLAAAAYDRALAYEISDPVRRFWLRARDAILPVCESPAIS